MRVDLPLPDHHAVIGEPAPGAGVGFLVLGAEDDLVAGGEAGSQPVGENVDVEGGRWTDEDYLSSLTAANRQLLQLFANFSRQLGPHWDFELFADHNAYDYEALAREDEDFNAGASLTWRQMRTLEIELRFDRIDRESTVATDEFIENRAYLGFRYIPDIGGQN